MVCVQCGQKTQIINSRSQLRVNQVWRRRKCLKCGSIFSTHEGADYAAIWAVKNAKGQLSPFLRDKLFLSLLRSCQHRASAVADAGALADTIIKKLLTQAKNGSIDSLQIVQTAQVALNRFDTVASVHYAAFHKS